VCNVFSNPTNLESPKIGSQASLEGTAPCPPQRRHCQSNHSTVETIPLSALPKDTSELSGLTAHYALNAERQVGKLYHKIITGKHYVINRTSTKENLIMGVGSEEGVPP